MLSAILDVLYGGIRPEIPGHGGEECASFLSLNTMFLESVLSTFMMIAVGIFGFYTFTMPQTFPSEKAPTVKKLMLIILCLVFGVECGYKICSRQVLYLLNPCHIITAIEVAIANVLFLDSQLTNILFRFFCVLHVLQSFRFQLYGRRWELCAWESLIIIM